MLYWAGVLVVLLISVVVFQVIVHRDYQKNHRLSWYSVGLEFLVFALHANLPYLYLDLPWPEMPPLPGNPLQRSLGIFVLAAGLILTLAIMSYLGVSTTLGQKPRKLRQTGPYHVTRNPQILTYGLALLGIVILYPSLETGAWFFLYGAIAHLMVLAEEAHLGKIFGLAFQDYRRRVPRYLPLPGLRGRPPKQHKE